MVRRLLVVLLSLVALSLTTAASAEWTKDVSYGWGSGDTSLKVTDPDGFKITVAVGGDVKEATIPTIFKLPKTDAYYLVTIHPKDGAAPWKKKIEIKKGKQAVLKVLYKAAAKKAKAKPAAKAASRSYIGKLINSTQYCTAKDQGKLRFDFLKNGKKAYSVTVDKAATKHNLDFTSGNYEVRVFVERSGQFEFFQTIKQDVDKDGWKLSMGCKKRVKRRRRRRRRR